MLVQTTTSFAGKAFWKYICVSSIIDNHNLYIIVFIKPLKERLTVNHNYSKPVLKNRTKTFKFDKGFKTVREKPFLSEIPLIF